MVFNGGYTALLSVIDHHPKDAEAGGSLDVDIGSNAGSKSPSFLRKIANFFHLHSATYDMDKSSKKRHKKTSKDKSSINMEVDLTVDSNVTVNRDDSFTIPEPTLGVSAIIDTDPKVGHSHNTSTTGDIKQGVDTSIQGNDCSNVLCCGPSSLVEAWRSVYLARSCTFDLSNNSFMLRGMRMSVTKILCIP